MSTRWQKTRFNKWNGKFLFHSRWHRNYSVCSISETEWSEQLLSLNILNTVAPRQEAAWTPSTGAFLLPFCLFSVGYIIVLFMFRVRSDITRELVCKVTWSGQQSIAGRLTLFSFRYPRFTTYIRARGLRAWRHRVCAGIRGDDTRGAE